MEDDAGLERLSRALDGAQEIAFDTEADSFYHYREQVCLIQVTVGEEDFVVDPLRELDLSVLGNVLADPQKTKVFHDGEYDVLILKRDFGFAFAGLFDTRIAAAALGVATPGLANVVLEHFGVELDKSQQRSDWSRRPLTASQIAYARQDTRYLIPLMHEYRRQLEERQRSVIVEGECRRLEGLESAERVFNPDEFVRLKGARNLRGHEMQALRELYVMRDELARQRDLPPFKILGNNVLVAIARARPKDTRQLERIDGLPPKLAKRWGGAVMTALERARELGPMTRAPRLAPKDGTQGLDEEGVELHDRLKSWRKVRANAEEIDASLILNRLVLLRVAQERPRDERELREVDGMLEWQLELFGHELLEVVRTFEADLAAGRVELPRRGRGRRS